MHKFKAYRTFEENKVIASRFVDMTLDELDPGDVVVQHEVFDDQLQGRAVVQRRRQDHAQVSDQRRHRHGRHGRVVDGSALEARRQGDRPRATTWASRTTAAMRSTCACPADWIVRRPESMTAFDAMTLGTAGFTAAQAIMLMEHNGLKPENGPVAVTGATGGVGSVAIEILAKTGYHVVAITGKAEETSYLKALGAKEVLLRQVDRPREDPAARKSDVGGRGRQPGRRHPRVAAVDDEDRRHGRARSGSRRA